MGEHTVPATARYAEELTDGALALRLQAITRLGVASAPRHLSSINASAEDVLGGAARSEAAGGGAAKEGRKLSVVPPVAGATDVVAAPGQPDGARASLETADTNPADTAASTAPEVVKRVAGGREGRPGAAPALPEVRVWGARLAQAVSEVLAGDRPISQLVRFTDDVVFMELNRRVRMLGMNSTAGIRGAKEKSMVRSVRVFMPDPCIAEVAAHVRHGQRSRAVAFRLEVRRNRWVCTALELG
ncbi:Rv3235 family protein [Kribbella sp. VKM Ac-2569]|uniref:Rv3235 family protein n=1 Tax=Kribbella sp. VKM Ac-2569 TaxID=2512220 RepID=UPI00102BC088|nr:Rv3235 family protein [Kribbella sp. VKM Ac-2569]